MGGQCYIPVLLKVLRLMMMMMMMMNSDEDVSEVEMPLAGLVQVHGVGFWGAEQVEASQGLAGHGLGTLGGVSRPLLHKAGLSGERRGVAGGVKTGAPL